MGHVSVEPPVDEEAMPLLTTPTSWSHTRRSLLAHNWRAPLTLQRLCVESRLCEPTLTRSSVNAALRRAQPVFNLGDCDELQAPAPNPRSSKPMCLSKTSRLHPNCLCGFRPASAPTAAKARTR